jgi:hypothetical protein
MRAKSQSRPWGAADADSILVAIGVRDQVLCKVAAVAEGSKDDEGSSALFLRYWNLISASYVDLPNADEFMGSPRCESSLRRYPTGAILWLARIGSRMRVDQIVRIETVTALFWRLKPEGALDFPEHRAR